MVDGDRPERGTLGWFAVSLVLFVLVGCSQAIQEERDVEYVPGKHLDVFPPGHGGPSPIVVLLHGAGLDRHDYEAFATLLAERGMVVYNVDWSVLPTSSEAALEEVACAVRHARTTGPAFGGDAENILLVGHSSAAVYAGSVATGRDEASGMCATTASALPNGLALLAPAHIPGSPPWPFASLDGNIELRIAIIHGQDDRVMRLSRSERAVDILDEAGYEVTLSIVSGGHNDIVLVSGDDGDVVAAAADPAQESIDVIMQLAETDGL